MKTLLLCSASFFLAICAHAQPVIRPGSVVNAANNLLPGFPNAGLAQGGMFVLKVRNLGARGTVVANSYPLATTMGGVSIRITVRGTTVDALMVYVVGGLSDRFGPFDQLAGNVPSNTPTGNASITVTYNNQTSAPAFAEIRASAFGIFTINETGIGPGVFTDPNNQTSAPTFGIFTIKETGIGPAVFTDPNFRVNTFVNSAHPGDLLSIWGTGLGAISGNDGDAPPVGDLNVPVEVYVGGIGATIRYQGRSECCAGIDQILIEIPPGVEGCFVPVVVKIGNFVSNFATVSIASSGSVCSDPAGFRASELQDAASAITIGGAGILRLSARLTLPGAGTSQATVDLAGGDFKRYAPGGIFGSLRGAVAGFNGFPSQGCTVVPGDPTLQFYENILYLPPDPVPGVDAGAALNISSPAGSRQLPRGNNGGDFSYEFQVVGGGLPPLTPPPLPEYLVPGNYTLTNASGGPGGGAFSAALTVPSLPANVWTNQDAIFDIPRSQDLTITLNPPGSDFSLGLYGGSIGAPGGGTVPRGVSFYCSIPPGATSFTAPAYVMSAMLASAPASDVPGARLGFLSVLIGSANPGRFQSLVESTLDISPGHSSC